MVGASVTAGSTVVEGLTTTGLGGPGVTSTGLGGPRGAGYGAPAAGEGAGADMAAGIGAAAGAGTGTEAGAGPGAGTGKTVSTGLRRGGGDIADHRVAGCGGGRTLDGAGEGTGRLSMRCAEGELPVDAPG